MARQGGDDLGEQVKRGSMWSIAGTGGSQVLSFGIGVVLARLLLPADFGIIAASLVFLEVGSTLIAASFTSTLIRRSHVSELDLSTAFVLQLICAVAVVLLLVLVSPAIAQVMDNERIALVLPALSMSLMLLAFRGCPMVIARRAMNFRLTTLAGFTEIVTFGAVAVSMAWTGFGIWSLVAGRIAGQLVSLLQLCYATGWYPRLRASWSVSKSLLGMSTQFAGKEILDDVSRNIGYFFVGARLGVEPLGYYSRAHYLMTLPVTQLASAISNVLFPAFAKIQEDDARISRGLVKATCLVCLAIYPVLVGLVLVAPSFMTVIYGAKWAPSIVPLQIICFAGLFYAADPPAVAVINAKGYLWDDIKRQIVHVLLLIAGVVVGSRWGIAGVAVAVTITAFVYWVLLVQLMKSRLGLSVRSYLEALAPAVIGCVAMAIAVLTFQHFAAQWSARDSAAMLFGSVGVGVAVYAVSLWLLNRLMHWRLFNDCFAELTGPVFGFLKRTRRHA